MITSGTKMSAILHAPIQAECTFLGRSECCWPGVCYPILAEEGTRGRLGGGSSKSQDCSPNSLENVKGAFSTLGRPNLQKHILALGCPRNDYLPICSCEEFSRPAPLRSAYLSHGPLMGQLRVCEASSNYPEPLPGPRPPTPMANLISVTRPHPNRTRRPPEHTSLDTQDTVGAQLRHA